MSHFVTAQTAYHAAMEFAHNGNWLSAKHHFVLCIASLERYVEDNNEQDIINFKWVTHNIPNIITTLEQMPVIKNESDYMLVQKVFYILKRFCDMFDYSKLAHFFQLAELCLTAGLSLSQMDFVNDELTKLDKLPYLPIHNNIDLFLANNIKTLVMLLQRECGKPSFPSILLKYYIHSEDGSAVLTNIAAKLTECINNYMIQSALKGEVLPETVLQELMHYLINKNVHLSEKETNLKKQWQQAGIDGHLKDNELEQLKKKLAALETEYTALKERAKLPGATQQHQSSSSGLSQLSPQTSTAANTNLLPPISFFDKYLDPSLFFSPSDSLPTLLSPNFLISLENLSKRMAQLSERVVHFEEKLQFTKIVCGLKNNEIERLRSEIVRLEGELRQSHSFRLFTPIILQSAGVRTIPSADLLTVCMGQVFTASSTTHSNDAAAHNAVESDSDRTDTVSPASPS